MRGNHFAGFTAKRQAAYTQGPQSVLSHIMDFTMNQAMSSIWVAITLLVVVQLLRSLLPARDKNGVAYKLPPGPRGWPIIGNTFQIPTENPTPVLAELADKYGEMYIPSRQN